jgi:hypothetical protein
MIFCDRHHMRANLSSKALLTNHTRQAQDRFARNPVGWSSRVRPPAPQNQHELRDGVLVVSEHGFAIEVVGPLPMTDAMRIQLEKQRERNERDRAQ